MKAINPFVRQRDFNRASRPNFAAFAPHRARVLHLLETLAATTPTPNSLCILGAGNCNDLDLPRLTALWSRLRLIDIDLEAMRSGLTHQLGASVPPHLELTTCDLTGALEHLHELIHTPTSAALARLRHALLQTPAPTQIPERFSAVASTCILSQLTDLIRHALGPASPHLDPLAGLARLQHLRTLAELTAPGGHLLLLADFVSSDTLPALRHAAEEELPALMNQALSQGNHFIGMNPWHIHRTLTQPPLAPLWAAPPSLSTPWRWNLGPRTYLVTAIQCRKRQSI